MKSLRYVFCLLAFFSSLLLAGCGDSNDPAKVVEHYLAAKVAQDEDTVRNLLCSEMEERYEMELLSFEFRQRCDDRRYAMHLAGRRGSGGL